MGEKAKLTAKTLESKGKHPVSKSPGRVFQETRFSPADQILHLQRTMGNQAVQRLLKSGTIQAKLTIGKPNDKYEQEADRVAEQVMRMPEPNQSLVNGHSSLAQRKSGCPECPEKEEIQTKPLAEQITPLVQRQVGPEKEEESVQGKLLQRQEKEEEEQTKLQRQPEEEEEKPVQAKPANSQTPSVSSKIESGINSLKGGGQPLSESTRSYFESRFGADFSQVRVHTDSNTSGAAKSVNARAFTTGNDVVFGTGQYSPETSPGKKLIAHELMHVVQQEGQKDNMVRRSPDNSEWGGFRISGSPPFIETVRQELNTLNGTTQGRKILTAISKDREPWYRSLIRIKESGVCGFLPTYILYNSSGCRVSQSCTGADSEWQSVPNYVYLFHEIVHVYEYLIGGRGTHRDRECMVTGLGRYFTSIPYNENKLRCELGLPVRPCYNGECSSFPSPTCSTSNPGMKTRDGECKEKKEDTQKIKEEGTEGTEKERFYIVKKGDTLSKIAKEFYGEAKKYNVIFEANRDVIKNPNLIYPGQKLKIPIL